MGERFDVALIERLLPGLAWVATNSIARQWQSKVAASDIIQDTFIEATQTLPAFSGSTIGEFNEWLRAILVNNVRDSRRRFVDAQMRSVKRERSLNRLSMLALAATDPSPGRAAESNEFDRNLHHAIQSLDSIDRRIVNFRYQQKLTFAEVGDRMEMKEETIRKRWGRILNALQQRLHNFDSRVISRQA